MNICIFGDSITWGARLPFRVGWANLLRNYLEKVSDFYISVYDLGIDGDTSEGLLKRFETEAEARKPDLIIHAIGTNDSCYRLDDNKNIVSVEKFKENVSKLIYKSLKITDKVMFVGLAKGDDLETVPLLRSTSGKCYDKKNIEKYNNIISKISSENGIEFINLINRLKDKDFDDGLHPNIEGHLKIYESVRSALVNILKIKTDAYYVLVDTDDKEIGYKKRENIELSDIPRVSALWIENPNDEVLLAKRPYDKKRDPGKWGPAVASLVKKDTNYRNCLLTASKDELGLISFDFKEKDKLLVKGYNNFYVQWYFAHLDKSLDDFVVNKDEVIELKWINKIELEKQLSEKPFLFVQSFDKYYKLF